jgi:colicin import membrane protein
MTSAAAPHDTLLPQPHGGMGAGVGISLLAHAALLAALAGVVQWRTQAPQAVAAELWAAVPERAAQGQQPPTPPTPPAQATVAPPPPPPPAATATVTPRVAPVPPEPVRPSADIATERAAAQAERQRQQRAEREKAEKAEQAAELAQAKKAEEAAKAAKAEKAEKANKEAALAERQRKEQQAQAQAQALARSRAAQEAKEAREAEARTEAARQDNLRRMMAQAGQTAGAAGANAGTGSRDAAPSAGYRQRIAALIHGNTVFNGEVSGNPAAEVEVRAAASGSILSRRLIKSSGNAAWDEAVLKAIDRTATLPRDTDGRVPPTLIIEFRPKVGAG